MRLSIFLLTLFCYDLNRSPVHSESTAVHNDLPHIQANWSWTFEFHHPENNLTNRSVDYEFKPSSSQFTLEFNDTNFSSKPNMLLTIRPSLANSKLSECTLLILVERDRDYFAWTQLNLTYKFNPGSTSQGREFPQDQQTAASNANQKFLTKVSEIYECESLIPIPLGKDVNIILQNMTFQAFDAVALPSDQRLREVCPRDFKSNFPITVLTGVSLLILIAIAVTAFGVNMYLNNRKSKDQ